MIGNGVKEDELQSILNYLTTMHEVCLPGTSDKCFVPFIKLVLSTQVFLLNGSANKFVNWLAPFELFAVLVKNKLKSNM